MEFTKIGNVLGNILILCLKVILFWMSDEFVEMFKHKTGYEIVEPAHMVISVIC